MDNSTPKIFEVVLADGKLPSPDMQKLIDKCNKILYDKFIKQYRDVVFYGTTAHTNLTLEDTPDGE